MPPESTPATAPAKAIVTKEGDSLFGKVFTILKEDASHIVAEIETEFGKVEAIFHKSNVVRTTAPTTAETEPSPLPAATVATSTAGTPTTSPEAAPVAATASTETPAPASS